MKVMHPIRRLFTYMRPYKTHFRLSILASLANKIADLMPPLLVAWVIDTVSGNAPQWIKTVTGSETPWTLSIFLAILAVLIFAFESGFQWAYKYGFMTLAQKVQHQLRLDTYKHLQKREVAFFENNRLGNTLSILGEDINQLERFLYGGFVELLHLSVVVIFSGYIMFTTSWQLALFGMIPVPIVIWGSLYYQRRISPKYTAIRESAGQLNSRLENNISGILVIKSFTAENFEYDRVKVSSQNYMSRNLEAIKLNALYVPIIRMAVAVGFAGVLLIGSYWILNGAHFITVGQLVLFSMLIQRLLWPLTQIGVTLDNLERAGASALRVFGILDTPSKIQNPENPVSITTITGEITFNKVSFHYRPDIPILTNISCTIKAGETIGIAGTTGSGKSTLIKLLLRLYDPTEGEIKFDCTPLTALRLKDIRRNIALVSQDVYLFHGSIYDNISYGLTTVSYEQVIKASKLAELDDFISELPEGYKTLVGERGIKLSGGQRQRLSIARAILKNAPIMIFDEATSAVDTETERAIQKNITKLTQGKTAIVIAHRLSTIRYADRIMVIENGHIVEEGTHDTLLLNKKSYADLWALQIGAQ